ncbi:choline dehydrogenase [Neptunicoccus cionae]|uniref:Choline dehydrogenase n=1 Tax=Neptunicoccus cionae TaxID=2035344 RepID=A0A916QUW3_9RHOB|nr:choline dehydrogenase [Amylibacter cionae]GGA10126.1 choline dehydrogenase [Amylibacter cionae]
MKKFDYIIVGAGSAGCVLANKLGADRAKSILVLEAGPADRDIMIHIPAGVYRAWRDPKINWNYIAEPDEGVDNRGIDCPRGRVVGGSSSINSMVYMRGHPLDYDRWASEHGLSDWSYAHCLPYFKAGETSDRGADTWRGASGPLGVSKGSYDNPLYDAFLDAGDQAGQGRSDDLNGFNPEGVARFDATRWNGRRCSAAVAHLRPALARGNVSLITRAQVAAIDFDGTRAKGVTYWHKGKKHSAEAAEIILSGGAINSPQLLMLAGIGPADELARHNIPCRVDLPGVGRNLMDHPTIILQFESLKRYPIHRINHPLRKGMAGAWWLFTRKGAAASNIWEAGGLVRSNADTPYPNLQYHFGPMGFEYHGDKITVNQGFTFHVDLLRPRSRGAVTLNSADPMDKPLIKFNYFKNQADLRELSEGIGMVRDLVSQKAFGGLAGDELSTSGAAQSPDTIADWVRKNSETDFHPSGTCKMGDGPEAVTDDEGRVHGVEALRVVDASLMPMIPSGNLNAPTQLIASKIADRITGTPPPAPIHARFAFQA